jgi:hypothetical protein
MTRNARIALILAAVLVAVVAAVVIGSGGDDNKKDQAATTSVPAGTPTSTPTTPAKPKPKPVPVFRLRDGKPVGGVKTLEVKSGKRVRFVVTADTEQEVHVHGYDIEKTVPAGGRATFSFKATSQGVYEVESHTTSEQIAKLKVVP